jgi:hypothetical protein
MLHHRTTDPFKRAAHVADREAAPVWGAGHGYTMFLKTWTEVYRTCSGEFVQQADQQTDRHTP